MKDVIIFNTDIFNRLSSMNRCNVKKSSIEISHLKRAKKLGDHISQDKFKSAGECFSDNESIGNEFGPYDIS